MALPGGCFRPSRWTAATAETQPPHANRLTVNDLRSGIEIALSRGGGRENEKRIIDSGSFADDAGAGERAGRGPRVRDRGPSVLRWLSTGRSGVLIGVLPMARPYFAYPNAGEVKLDTKVKDAGVFINGAYAGTTHDNKTMHLRPGSYNIEIREAGRTAFAEKVYVVAGKTLHLHPEL